MNIDKIFSKKNENNNEVIRIFGAKISLKKKWDYENNSLLQKCLSELADLRIFCDKLQNVILPELMKKQNCSIENLIKTSINHKEVFPKYRNINNGKDVALIATGPSLKDFKPIENAVYVGVNKAFKYENVKFDYLFLQDYSGATKTYIEDFCNYDSKKFIGYISDYIQGAMQCIIPEKYSYYPNVERYYIAHPTEKSNFTFDIATQPFGDAYSIAFPAMQFILWTNPKRIYIVGCDCTEGGYHDSNDKNVLATNEVIEGWKRMKEFAKTYYPDTEIISINPVGLKGIFKDEYQN